MTGVNVDQGELSHLKAECKDCGRMIKQPVTQKNKMDHLAMLEDEFGRHIDDGMPCHDYKIIQVWEDGSEYRLI